MFNKEMIKNALILCAITIVAGLLLGGVYEITKSAREEQQEKTKTNSYKEVMADADSFKEMDVNYDKIKSLLEAYDITEKNAIVDVCIKALDKEGNIIGYVISTTCKEGYGGNISMSVGFDMQGKMTGVAILSINETAGLGMNAKDESFLKQYDAEGDGLYIVNKSDSEDGINIDALSGATITSDAVTKGVNTAKITATYLLKNVEQDMMEGGETDE